MPRAEPDRLDAYEIESWLGEHQIPLGGPLHLLAQTTSTNVDAHNLARDGATHGTLVVADRQSEGRGREGRRWHSPPGENLYLSLVLRPALDIQQLAPLPLVIGLAVVDVVCRWVEPNVVGLKWPNDIMVRGRKVAGVLTESTIIESRCSHVVAGIGLNVHQTDFDPEIRDIATSLALETPQPLARSTVLLELLASLSRRLWSFEQGGLAVLLRELRERDVTRGRRVRSGDRVGAAEGIGDDGRLRVRWNSGVVESIHSGEVSLHDAESE